MAPPVPEPRARWRLRLLALAGAALLAWTLVGAYVFTLQERLLFPGAFGLPDRPEARARLAAQAGVSPRDLRSGDDTILGWWTDAGTDRAVLYVGGNFSPIEASVPLSLHLRDAGWSTLALAPRGWPGSTGTPGEAAFAQDVLTGWHHLTGELGLDGRRVVLMGRSMGGGAVGTVMHELPSAGVVLRSTFDGVTPMAKARYPWLPVGWLLKHRFDTVSRAPQVTVPVFQVHSTADQTIPVARARVLRDAFPPDLLTYVEVDGLGHDAAIVLQDAEVRRRLMAFLEAAAPRTGP